MEFDGEGMQYRFSNRYESEHRDCIRRRHVTVCTCHHRKTACVLFGASNVNVRPLYFRGRLSFCAVADRIRAEAPHGITPSEHHVRHIFPEDVPKLSLTIGRKGGVREWEPFDETRHIQVLLVQPDDGNRHHQFAAKVDDASHLCGTVHKPLREYLIHRRSVAVGLNDTDRGQRSNDLPGSDADAGRGHPQALAAQATTPFRTEGEIRCWTTSP